MRIFFLWLFGILFCVPCLMIAGFFLSIIISELTNSFWNKTNEKFKSSSKVYLAEVTNYDWDTVCILSPYSDPEEIIKNSQSYLGDFENKLPNVDDDGLWAFAFIKNKIVIKIEKKGLRPHLKSGYKNDCTLKENANFTLDGEYAVINDE